MNAKERYTRIEHARRKAIRDRQILDEYLRRELLEKIQFSVDTTLLMTLSDGPPDSAADLVANTLGYQLDY